MNDSERKTVLVTGGARGIGAEISRVFAENGFKVTVHCNQSVDDAIAFCAEFPWCDHIRADLSKPESVFEIAQKCPCPDVLVNNAGIALVKPFDAVSQGESAKLYAVDLFAPIELSRLYAPAMIKRKSGSIVNVSSVFGKTGGSCEVDYSAAKAGLIGFTKALAKELGPSGIRVNCVCPGIIDTDMNGDLGFEDVERLSDDIPLCRFGTAREVAEAVYFLACGGYVTGAVLDVNGGWE
ncbi:MAG: SDR family NAD(P)-dependent oxidoreductase [Clostridia bacterium]|nr:SDR family NAD(P)-dependent oxidoreductase [Clostridia bacterium]